MCLLICPERVQEEPWTRRAVRQESLCLQGKRPDLPAPSAGSLGIARALGRAGCDPPQPGWESCLTLGNPSSSFLPSRLGFSHVKCFKAFTGEKPKERWGRRDPVVRGPWSCSKCNGAVCWVFFQMLLPDPILKLRTIIGFGGYSTKWVSNSDGLGSSRVIVD